MTWTFLLGTWNRTWNLELRPTNTCAAGRLSPHVDRKRWCRMTFDRVRLRGLAAVAWAVGVAVGPAVVKPASAAVQEAFRLTKAELPTGLDLVIIPRGAVIPTLDELKQSLAKLVPQVARRLAKGPREVPAL